MNIEHEFLKYKGFEAIEEKLGILFKYKNSSLLDINYNTKRNVYDYQYPFEYLLTKFGSHKANINPQSYKLYKRSRTIKKVLNDYK